MADAPTPEVDSQEGASKPAEAEAPVSNQGGRRRGRRKVMKKKTVKDEEGYLGKSETGHGSNGMRADFPQ